MTSAVTTQIDERGSIAAITQMVRAGILQIGLAVQNAAAGSMQPQNEIVVRQGKRIKHIYAQTPNGQPPKTRQGLIKSHIAVAITDPTTVIVGPEALANHDTDCLARLEYGHHPFMQPALEATAQHTPELWTKAG